MQFFFLCVQLPLKKVMFSYVFHAANFYTSEVLRLPTAMYEKLVVNAINSAKRSRLHLDVYPKFSGLYSRKNTHRTENIQDITGGI